MSSSSLSVKPLQLELLRFWKGPSFTFLIVGHSNSKPESEILQQRQVSWTKGRQRLHFFDSVVEHCLTTALQLLHHPKLKSAFLGAWWVDMTHFQRLLFKDSAWLINFLLVPFFNQSFSSTWYIGTYYCETDWVLKLLMLYTRTETGTNCSESSQLFNSGSSSDFQCKLFFGAQNLSSLLPNCSFQRKKPNHALNFCLMMSV